MPDGDEEPAHRNFGTRTILHVLKQHTIDHVLTQHIDHGAVPVHGDVGCGEHPLLHGAGGAEFTATVNDVHHRCELGQVAGLFHGGVSTAHDRQWLVAEDRKCTITDGTGGNAAAGRGQPHLVFKPQPVGGSSGGDDHAVSQHLTTIGSLQSERSTFEVALHDIDAAHPGPESLGLLLEMHHHFRAGDAIGKAGIVLDFRGEHQLPTGQNRRRVLTGHAHQAEGLEIGPCRIDRRGPTRGAGTDDHDFFYVFLVGHTCAPSDSPPRTAAAPGRPMVVSRHHEISQ